jgi:dTDP-4-dehydrorhamnose 3,5-epimerase
LLGRDDLTVTGISTDEYYANKPEAAPRPLLSTLDLSKLEATGFKTNDWHDDLSEYIKKEVKK